MAANEDVMTTDLTEGAYFLAECRIPVVPLIAVVPQRADWLEISFK